MGGKLRAVSADEALLAASAKACKAVVALSAAEVKGPRPDVVLEDVRGQKRSECRALYSVGELGADATGKRLFLGIW